MTQRIVLLVAILFVVAFGIVWRPTAFNVPDNWCVPPYRWAACYGWDTAGLYWGHPADNFVSVNYSNDHHWLWNGRSYDVVDTRYLMIQSTLFRDWDHSVGDCNGWIGICVNFGKRNREVIP